MKFWKLHGIGNDFIAIDGRNDGKSPSEYSSLALQVCNRRMSVGADGLLVVKNSNIADIEMVYYNSDGSRADLGDVINIKVDMGEGSFKTSDIPMATDKEKFIEERVHILDRDFTITSMLMGVPHTIVFIDEFDLDMIEKYGPAIENCDLFPEKTNVNFVKVRDQYNINVYTWERGCGYTLGCGTGMTAAAIICNYLGKTEKSMNVTSKGGTVKIDIGDKVFMTGPAVKICEGYLEV